MDVRVTTDLAAEPILKAEMRNYLEFTATDTTEDTLIESMIKSARILLERKSNLSFGAKTLQVLFRAEELINDSVMLPYSPLISITSVKAVDAEETKTALTLNSGYFKRGLKNVELIISYSGTGLVGSDLSGSDIEVIYVTGYGNAATETLPETWRELIRRQVKIWYLRGDEANYTELDFSIKMAADSLSNNIWL